MQPLQRAVRQHAEDVARHGTEDHQTIRRDGRRGDHGATGVDAPLLFAVRVERVELPVGRAEIDRAVTAEGGRGDDIAAGGKGPLEPAARVEGEEPSVVRADVNRAIRAHCGGGLHDAAGVELPKFGAGRRRRLSDDKDSTREDQRGQQQVIKAFHPPVARRTPHGESRHLNCAENEFFRGH